jgi:hypothetical protein
MTVDEPASTPHNVQSCPTVPRMAWQWPVRRGAGAASSATDREADLLPPGALPSTASQTWPRLFPGL